MVSVNLETKFNHRGSQSNQLCLNNEGQHNKPTTTTTKPQTPSHSGHQFRCVLSQYLCTRSLMCLTLQEAGVQTAYLGGFDILSHVS